jgi:glutamate N-acetyltransferase / amino-acid N-acetyltransferase
MFQVSPLAPKAFPELPAVAGVKLAVANAAIKQTQRPDVLLMQFDAGTTAAGVFTRSLTASSAVELCRKNLKSGTARALIVNSGNSNAFTGAKGEAAMARVIADVAALAGAKESECFMASTGVIGQVLPDEKIRNVLPALAAGSWMDAARAIMTTDTFPKLATRECVVAGEKITLNGIAKGSGMIAPDMATMLAFVVTDATIPAPILQAWLAAANDVSFNAVTVDGDTSTSDTLMLFATGKTKASPTSAEDAAFAPFKDALQSLLVELAQAVVKDGEGASKFIEISVTGAEHAKAARTIGMSIANSPLVKTAIAGGDANWGRVVMAVGKAGEKADRDKLTITFGTQTAAKNGELNPEYNDDAATEYLKGEHIKIGVDVGIGQGSSTVWTCDLTHGYIDINGAYRT